VTPTILLLFKLPARGKGREAFFRRAEGEKDAWSGSKTFTVVFLLPLSRERGEKKKKKKEPPNIFFPQGRRKYGTDPRRRERGREPPPALVKEGRRTAGQWAVTTLSDGSLPTKKTLRRADQQYSPLLPWEGNGGGGVSSFHYFRRKENAAGEA